MPIPMTPALVADLERSELRVWSAVYKNAPAAAIAACGIGMREFPPAMALWMSKIDVLACNRVLGLGLEGPPDRRTVDGIVASFEQAMVPRFFVQLAPLVTVGPTITAFTDAGFAKYNNWVRLVRGVASPGPAPTELRIEEIGTEAAGTFGELLCTGFGWSPALGLPVAAMVGTPGWKFYLAYRGDRPVGTAVLVIDGLIGWFGFASMLPEARGLGGQAALLQRRILDARSSGCGVLSVETAEQTPEREAPSYRNVLRAGFEAAYVRPNYLYRFPQRDQA